MATLPIPDNAADLTERQIRFVAEYVSDNDCSRKDAFNGTRAYIKAYGQMSQASAARGAMALLARPEVQAEIVAARREWASRCRLSYTKVIRKLAAIAFQDPDDYYEADPENGGLPKLRAWDKIDPTARKNIRRLKITRNKLKADSRTKSGDREVTESYEVERLEYETLDPMAALDTLCKYLGLTKGSLTADELREIVAGAVAGGAAGAVAGAQAARSLAAAPEEAGAGGRVLGAGEPAAPVEPAERLHPNE